jgi:hypothetical protein
MPNGRPMWELKAVAFLLAAVAGLAALFGVITHDLFNAIFLAVVNYFLANANGSKIQQLVQKLKAKFAKPSELTIFSVDWALKVVFAGFGFLTVVFYYVNLVDYSTVSKVLYAFIAIMMANLGWLEYKEYKIYKM